MYRGLLYMRCINVCIANTSTTNCHVKFCLAAGIRLALAFLFSRSLPLRDTHAHTQKESAVDKAKVNVKHQRVFIRIQKVVIDYGGRRFWVTSSGSGLCIARKMRKKQQ